MNVVSFPACQWISCQPIKSLVQGTQVVPHLRRPPLFHRVIRNLVEVCDRSHWNGRLDMNKRLKALEAENAKLSNRSTVASETNVCLRCIERKYSHAVSLANSDAIPTVASQIQGTQ